MQIVTLGRQHWISDQITGHGMYNCIHKVIMQDDQY